jgi:hypothetical protein
VPHATLSINSDEIVIPTDGGAVRLPLRQIRAWAYFGSEPMMRQAIVDTGCPACTLPKRIWERLDRQSDIAWIADPPATVPVGALTRTTVLLGGRYPYRLGRVRLRIVDLGDGQLAPREVMALCTEDGAGDRPEAERLPLILGLAEVLNGRALLLQVSENGARWSALLNEP